MRHPPDPVCATMQSKNCAQKRRRSRRNILFYKWRIKISVRNAATESGVILRILKLGMTSSDFTSGGVRLRCFLPIGAARSNRLNGLRAALRGKTMHLTSAANTLRLPRLSRLLSLLIMHLAIAFLASIYYSANLRLPLNGSRGDIGAIAVNSPFVPQSVNSASDPCCGLHEWPVFPLRGSNEFYARAAFPTPQAHAVEEPNSHTGLILLKNSDVGHLGQI